jgi:hypothetical protein
MTQKQQLQSIGHLEVSPPLPILSCSSLYILSPFSTRTQPVSFSSLRSLVYRFHCCSNYFLIFFYFFSAFVYAEVFSIFLCFLALLKMSSIALVCLSVRYYDVFWFLFFCTVLLFYGCECWTFKIFICIQ